MLHLVTFVMGGGHAHACKKGRGKVITGDCEISEPILQEKILDIKLILQLISKQKGMDIMITLNNPCSHANQIEGISAIHQTLGGGQM